MEVDEIDETGSLKDPVTEVATKEILEPATDGRLLSPNSEQRPLLSVVIPTLDEEEGIAECIARIKNALDELGIYGEVIVSDSSTDRTPEIARELGAIVVKPDKKGYGYAYQYGFEYARGDFIAMGDADTTYDFEELPKLYRPIVEGKADIAMGDRLGGEIMPGAMPRLHKYIGNPLLTKFLNTFYDAGVNDAHSGMRIFTRDALETLDLRTMGMEFASEMIMDAGEKGLLITERPITYHPRKGEATLDSFRDGWGHVKFMLMNAPGYLFSAPGILFGVFGLVIMLFSLFGKQIAGVTFGTHTIIAGSLFMIVGYQIGSLALFSSVATDPILEPSDPITRAIRQRFNLEHGATIGLTVSGIGAVYLVTVVVQWISSGFTEAPFVVMNMAAFTAVVLGVQTVFNSFFLSMLSEQ